MEFRFAYEDNDIHRLIKKPCLYHFPTTSNYISKIFLMCQKVTVVPSLSCSYDIIVTKSLCIFFKFN